MITPEQLLDTEVSPDVTLKEISDIFHGEGQYGYDKEPEDYALDLAKNLIKIIEESRRDD